MRTKFSEQTGHGLRFARAKENVVAGPDPVAPERAAYVAGSDDSDVHGVPLKFRLLCDRAMWALGCAEL
jgi:hypothetical protein